MKHQIGSISQNHKRNHQITTLTKILFIVLILSAYSQSAFAEFYFPSQPRDYVGNDRYHQPAIDFDTDSCFPSSAVDSNGKLNPGISDKSITGGCRPSYNGHANIYARSKCQKEGGKNYCAHVWGLYFVKDYIGLQGHAGHLHDWEHMIVYAIDNVPTHGGVSAHGGVDLRAWKDIPHKTAKNFNAVYHKDGALTHALRFAERDESTEVGYMKQTILSWAKLNAKMKKGLNDTTHFGKATLELRDDRFINFINKWRPKRSAYPTYVGATYKIRVKTGTRDKAGTDANVSITVFGYDDKEFTVDLDNDDYDDFESGDDDVYEIKVGEDIGEIRAITLRHDNTEDGAGWYVERVNIETPSGSKNPRFRLNRWLAKGEHDGNTYVWATPN